MVKWILECFLIVVEKAVAFTTNVLSGRSRPTNVLWD